MDELLSFLFFSKLPCDEVGTVHSSLQWGSLCWSGIIRHIWPGSHASSIKQTRELETQVSSQRWLESWVPGPLALLWVWMTSPREDPHRGGLSYEAGEATHHVISQVLSTPENL